MRKIAVLLLFVIVFAGCKDPGGSSSSSGSSGGSWPKAATENSGFGSAANLGDTGVLTVGNETVNMHYAQNQDSVTFPTRRDDSWFESLDTKFFMSETEVTNAVVATVLQWAYDHNRFNTTNSSAHNYLSTTTVKHGAQELLRLNDPGNYCKINYDGNGHFTVDTGYDDHPVVMISWYGAIMCCNWLTEMRDGNTDNLVYTGITTNWNHRATTEDVTKNGYRLPRSYEWEYAARYRSDNTNTVGGYRNPWYTKGNSLSDAITYYNNASGSGGDPGKSANDAVAVYKRYWDGAHWQPTGVTELAIVKTKRANDLGLFDMSGNVREWCFTTQDFLPQYRIFRGGNFGDTSYDLQVGQSPMDSYHPQQKSHNLGFRLCRTR